MSAPPTRRRLTLWVKACVPMIGKLIGHREFQTTARYTHLEPNSVEVSVGRVSESVAADFDLPRRVSVATSFASEFRLARWRWARPPRCRRLARMIDGVTEVCPGISHVGYVNAR